MELNTGGIPENARKTFDKLFWEKERHGAFYPLSAEDAYQYAYEGMIKAASKPPEELKSASRETYIVAAGKMRLKFFMKRIVEPKRKENVEMFDKCRVNGKLDTRQYSEARPGAHSYRRFRQFLNNIRLVYETILKLDDETQRGLLCYLLADGDITFAAELFGMSRRGYGYRLKRIWFKRFRRAVKWRW